MGLRISALICLVSLTNQFTLYIEANYVKRGATHSLNREQFPIKTCDFPYPFSDTKSPPPFQDKLAKI